MKNTVLVLALIFTLIASTASVAQSTTMIIEDVILFNNEPFMVKMTPKGKIIEFVKDIENNYNALNKIESKTSEMSEEEVLAAIDLARKDGNTLDVVAIQEARMKKEKTNTVREITIKDEVVPGKEMGAKVNTVTAIADNASNPDEEVASKGASMKDVEMDTGPSTTNYAYEFAFDHRDASLSPSSVNQLNEIANIMKEDSNTELEINSYFSESVDISRILSRNRSKGIHDMLVSKGIEASRIKISESNNEDWANNRVKVTIH